MREKARSSECGCGTLDPVFKLQPPSRLARERVDVKDVVFPFRLIWTVQEKVVGVGKGEIWDRRERRLEDHRQGGRWWREKEKGGSPSVGVVGEALYAWWWHLHIRRTGSPPQTDRPLLPSVLAEGRQPVLEVRVDLTVAGASQPPSLEQVRTLAQTLSFVCAGVDFRNQKLAPSRTPDARRAELNTLNSHVFGRNDYDATES
jgi:hypothetical protein